MNLGDRIANLQGMAGRQLTTLRRRHPRLRHLVPASVARQLISARSVATEGRKLYTPVAERCGYDNVFHCSVHKTGSQWLMSILSDPLVYRYSGLSFYYSLRATRGLDDRPTGARRYWEPFPAGRIVSPLYLTYRNFRAVPKEGSWRAFFVQRDPRDLLVSWYYSARDNHLVDRRPALSLYDARRYLQSSSLEDGLLFGLDYWHSRGRFEALRQWATQGVEDPQVRVVRFEDLRGAESARTFAELFEFLDIRLPSDALTQLLEVYSFRRLTGREVGQVDDRSHLRGGKRGEWREVFTPAVRERFQELGGEELVKVLGYEPE